jgi:CheY-like chemotaxis protein
MSAQVSEERPVRLLVLDQHPAVRHFFEYSARPRHDVVVETVDTPAALLERAFSRYGAFDVIVCDSGTARLSARSATIVALKAVARTGASVVLVVDELTRLQDVDVPGVAVVQRPVSAAALLALALERAGTARRV